MLIPAAQTSQPQFAPVGSLVTVTPGAGASAIVEYTLDGSASVRSGIAAWAPWPRGAVSAAAGDLLNEPAYVRVTAVGGAVDLDIDSAPSRAKIAPYTNDWASLSPQLSVDASGNVLGIAGLPLNRVKNSIALLGDSITLRNFPAVGNMYGSDGYFTVANAMMGWPFEIVGVSGNSGQTSTYILGRVDADILSITPLPRYCMVLAGTNDEPSSMSVEQTIANLKQIYTKLQSAGITPIVATLPPRNDAGMTQAKKRKDVQRNRWIREYARVNDVICCDFYRALVNPLSTGTGGWSLVADGNGALNDTSADQIHPTNYGGFVMANEVVRRLSARLNTQTRGGGPRYADCMHIAGVGGIPEGNVIPNGSFSGTAGVIGAVATGQLADEWSVQNAVLPAGGGTIVLSKVAKSDTFGYWQQMNISGGNAGDVQGQCGIRSDRDYPSANSVLDATTWQVGDSVFGQVAFETDAAGWGGSAFDTNCNLSLRIQFFGSTGAYTDSFCFAAGAGSSKSRMPSGVLKTPTLPIPPGTTRLYLWIDFRGRGVLRIGDAEIRKAIPV